MCIEDLDMVSYPNMRAWVLKDVVKYEQEMHMESKRGAVKLQKLQVESL